MNDHDLLIRIDERLSEVKADLAEIRGHATKRMNWIEGKIDIHVKEHAKWLLGTIVLVGTIIGVAKAF